MLRYAAEYVASFLVTAATLLGLHLRARYDVIAVYNQPDFFVFVALVPRLLGTRVVLMAVEPTREVFEMKFGRRSPLARVLFRAVCLFERLGMAFADRVVAVTTLQRDILVGRGVSGDKIDVVINTADERVFAARPDRTRQANEPFVLVTQGTIEHRYGHDLVVRAIAKLRHLDPPIEYVVMGAGSVVSQLEDLAASLGVADRIRVRGRVSTEEMVHTLSAADVGVVPLRRTGWSNLVHTNKMFELMALGKPIIASRLPPITAYFGESPAFLLFESDDVDELAKCIAQVHAERGDLSPRGLAARALYEQHSWAAQKSRYVSILVDLMRA